jgi:hypothetical protein
MRACSVWHLCNPSNNEYMYMMNRWLCCRKRVDLYLHACIHMTLKSSLIHNCQRFVFTSVPTDLDMIYAGSDSHDKVYPGESWRPSWQTWPAGCNGAALCCVLSVLFIICVVYCCTTMCWVLFIAAVCWVHYCSSVLSVLLPHHVFKNRHVVRNTWSY